MKILHVITGGQGRGGAEGALLRLVAESNERIQHRVFVLQPMPEYVDDFRALGVELECMYLHKPFRFLGHLSEIISNIRNFEPDAIQCWMYHSNIIFGLLARVLGIPVAWNIRQSDTSFHGMRVRTWVLMKLGALFSYVVPKRVINCSRYSISSHCGSGYRKSFVYIPNGYSVGSVMDAGVRSSLRKGLGVSDQDVVFGHVGRLHPVKNHQAFINAVRVLRKDARSVVALMIGTGVHRGDARFTEMSAESEGNFIHALGQRDDVKQLYSAMDCLVMTSWSEGFPNVVAEAMSAGVPCVVTDVGDAAEIVGDTGWVVSPGDEQALVAAINQVLEAMSDPIAWADRRAQARMRIAEHYSIKEMVRKYEGVWKDIQLS